MQENKSLISIIIPVYKVEPYLDRCIQSVIQQTYTNLEIILVDDGSPDQCPQICDAWSEKDIRISVIHKKNGGLSEARNFGIDASHGDFLMFVDSDDYISSEMCQELIDIANTESADIVNCNFYWVYEHKKPVIETIPIKNEKEILCKRNFFKYYFTSDSPVFVIACNKLYKRKVFFSPSHIRFPVGKLHEDNFTIYKLFFESDIIVVISKPLYYYVQRSGSIMANFNMQNIIDSMEYAKEIVLWQRENDSGLKELVDYACINTYVMLVMRCEDNVKLKKHLNLLEELRLFCLEHIKDFYHNPYASKKFKIAFILMKFNLFNFSLFLYIKLYKIIHSQQGKMVE